MYMPKIRIFGGNNYFCIMWQRIQTLYLAIATGLAVALFFCVKAFSLGPGGVHAEEFKYIQFIPYLVLLIVITILQLIALFTFNVRVLQMRTAVLSGILLGYLRLPGSQVHIQGPAARREHLTFEVKEEKPQALRDRIVTRTSPRIASQDSPDGESQPFYRPPLAESLQCICRAGRLEPASLRNIWPDAFAVEYDQAQEGRDQYLAQHLAPVRDITALFHCRSS